MPDPARMRRYREKKTYGLADIRRLTRAEIAALESKAREVLARKRDVVTPDTPEVEDGRLILFSTPFEACWESRGGTGITPAHRPSPEQPQHLPPLLEAPQPAPIFRLLPEESSLLPVSTAPPG